MAAPKRTNSAKYEASLAQIADLYLAGKRQTEIAKVIGVTQQVISRDLAELRKRWQAESSANFSTAKGEELAKIDNLENIALERWEVSKKPIRSKSVTHERIVLDEENKAHKGALGLTKAGEKGVLTKTIITTSKRDGDPKWLDIIGQCIDRRLKIFGLYAPTKTALTDPSGEKEFGSDTLTDQAAIDRLATLFNAARIRRDQEAASNS